MSKKAEVRKLNETGKRAGSDQRKSNVPVTAERRKVQRRRQIDPTTCEREYTDDEVEFMQALDQYKRTSGRMFPTCSEILEVLQALGYQKVASARAAAPAISAANPETISMCCANSTSLPATS
jgi:hypothetical protein